MTKQHRKHHISRRKWRLYIKKRRSDYIKGK